METTNRKLVLRNLQNSDAAGNYTCIAENGIGRATNYTTVYVRCKFIMQLNRYVKNDRLGVRT